MNTTTAQLGRVLHSLGIKYGCKSVLSPEIYYQTILRSLVDSHGSDVIYTISIAADDVTEKDKLPIEVLFKKLMLLTDSDLFIEDTHRISCVVVYPSYYDYDEEMPVYNSKQLDMCYPLAFPVTATWNGAASFLKLSRRNYPYSRYTSSVTGRKEYSLYSSDLRPLPVCTGISAVLIIRAINTRSLENTYRLIRLDADDLRRGVARLFKAIPCNLPLLSGIEAPTLPLHPDYTWIPSIPSNPIDLPNIPFKRLKATSNLVYGA
jgi:hypothetical protein